MSMDFFPDKEFHKLFDRISQRINLEGAGSPTEINERLRQRIQELKYIYGNDPLAPLRTQGPISQIRALISGGFARHAIDEAIANPHGEIALTLKLGKRRAQKILMKRRRRAWL